MSPPTPTTPPDDAPAPGEGRGHSAVGRAAWGWGLALVLALVMAGAGQTLGQPGAPEAPPAARELGSEAELTQLRRRVADQARQIFRLLSDDERSAWLASRLADPIPAVRLEAMRLAEQQLVDRPNLLDETVRASLLERLADPLSGMRRRATLLLRDLGHREAAGVAARRLAEGGEPDGPAAAAMLLTISRWPTVEAVPAAIDRLDAAEAGDAAAWMLTAAAEAGLLDEVERAQVRRLVRRIAKESGTTAARIRLIGKLANEDDWRWIEGLLEAPDEATRKAAAQAWAASSRPIEPLIARGQDPVIAPVMLLAVRERGGDAQLLRRLARLEPPTQELLESWGQTLEAVVVSAGPQATLEALRESSMSVDAKRRVAAAAIDSVAGAVLNGAVAGGEPIEPLPDEAAEREEARILLGLVLHRLGTNLGLDRSDLLRADLGRASTLSTMLGRDAAIDAATAREAADWALGWIEVGERDRGLSLLRRLAQRPRARDRAAATAAVDRLHRDHLDAGRLDAAEALRQAIALWPRSARPSAAQFHMWRLAHRDAAARRPRSSAPTGPRASPGAATDGSTGDVSTQPATSEPDAGRQAAREPAASEAGPETVTD